MVRIMVYKLTFDSAKSRLRYLSSIAWVLFRRVLETVSNSSSTVQEKQHACEVHEIEIKVQNCTLHLLRVWYLSDSLETNWRFPGRDGKAAGCAVCPQRSGKQHCSLGEALNPAVSSAVLASCRQVCIKETIFKNKLHYETVTISR